RSAPKWGIDLRLKHAHVRGRRQEYAPGFQRNDLAFHLLTPPHRSAYDGCSRMAADNNRHHSSWIISWHQGEFVPVRNPVRQRTPALAALSGSASDQLQRRRRSVWDGTSQFCAGLATGRSTSPQRWSRLPTRLPLLARPHLFFAV